MAYVGERPGREEMAQRLPFVGPSGEILWQLSTRAASLGRDDVYTTNLVKSYSPSNDDPTPEEVVYWGPLLLRELEEIQPELIVALGRFSASVLTGRDIRMDTHHGWVIPSVLGVPCRIVQHPAAGIHDPNRLSLTALDLHGNASLPHDPPEGDEGTLALDTEGQADDPWCVTEARQVKDGIEHRLWRTKDIMGVYGLKNRLVEHRPTVLLHNALHDLPVLKALGIDLVALGIPFRDTMIEAHILSGMGSAGDEEDTGGYIRTKGLKLLVERYYDVRLPSYDDVVGRLQDAKVREYLEAALSLPPEIWPAPEGKRWPVPRRIASLLKAPRGESPDSLRTRWGKSDVLPAVTSLLGDTPRITGDEALRNPGVVQYALDDARWLLPLGVDLRAGLRKDGLEAVADQDVACLPILAWMEEVGMPLDPSALEELSADLAEQAGGLLTECRSITADREFNPGSAEHVEEYCHQMFRDRGILKLEKPTKGKTRYSTDEKVLAGLLGEHPIIQKVLDYRAKVKLRTTFVEPLRESAVLTPDRGWRVFPKFKPATAVSGRYAMDKPSLLTIPVRSEDGKQIRKCFRAPDGWAIGVADLSQIEIRVCAALSGDRNMVAALKSGKDFHKATASALFGKKIEAITPEEKAAAKTGNFALLYRAQAKTLADRFKADGVEGWDVARCEEFRVEWYKLYPGVRRWQEEQIRLAKRYGYVRSPLGRRRYVHAVWLRGDRWPMRNLREEAERKIVNFPIQTGAQEVIKAAMPKVFTYLRDLNHGRVHGTVARPLLQVHDELDIEVRRFWIERVGNDMRGIMESVAPDWMRQAGVPLKASWASGPTWAVEK